MAGEIDIRFNDWPHPVNNANTTWGYDNITSPANTHIREGWRMPNSVVSDLNIEQDVPQGIHATPNGKVQIDWLTASTDVANAVKFFVKLSDVVKNTDPVNPSTFDLDTSVTDVSNGAGILNTCEVSITGASLTAGRGLTGVIRRDAGDVGDTLGADVIVVKVRFVADKA